MASNTNALGKQFNVGTGNAVTLNSLIKIIDNELQVRLPINYKKERIGDIKNSVADITRLKTISYRPRNKIQDGIKKYLIYENMINIVAGN